MAKTRTAVPHAIARMRADDQRMIDRHRHASKARGQRQNRRNVGLAILMLGIIAAIGFVGWTKGWMPAAKPAAKVQAPHDPFYTSRSGQVVTPLKGNLCRQLSFDNRTGQMSNEKTVACFEDDVVDLNAAPPASPTYQRFNSFRNAFGR